ncbi:NTP transferase domain-containing protein [Croceibacterium sp. TMG7-5b_MA50]|uniref:nucleotidyltransferase family protein n=1 Tax=Croceibacterium sp. TMG7-5b_MA50 TaxID=3121290 RepID=UPI003221FD43
MAERVLAAVLAAGQARRFGGGKLDAACAGRRLGSWALDAVAGTDVVDRVIIVPPVPPLFASASGWTLIPNPLAADGLGTSLAIAARHALLLGVEALLVVLADMPLVDTPMLRALLQAGSPAAVCHGERPGVPALLPAATLPALSMLDADHGAGGLLARTPELVRMTVAPELLLDVDEPAALARAAAALLKRRR